MFGYQPYSFRIASTGGRLSDPLGIRGVLAEYETEILFEIVQTPEGERLVATAQDQELPYGVAAFRLEEMPCEGEAPDKFESFRKQNGAIGLIGLLVRLAACIDEPFVLRATRLLEEEPFEVTEWRVEPQSREVVVTTKWESHVD